MLIRLVAALLAFVALSLPATAQRFSEGSPAQQGRDKGVYTPAIWIDPDGCEHWVMDDGAEGYMTPHTDRQGIPVCHRGDLCATMRSDQFFATDSARISQEGAQNLRAFFRKEAAVSYVITGHTDSRASDAYNMKLSLDRARAVARVAEGAGAQVAQVRGLGERRPAATNATADGMAKNRRVEILCIR
ncbi:MAG: OmpA family protein [Pseudomonadota bacterium]